METPSTRAVCRVLNKNSCGSGSICGRQPSGKSLILTNAHVAGTSIGRTVQVFVESKNETISARVIMAAYSNQTIADWAILETIEQYTKVEPVLLSKIAPTVDAPHYTKGFPRCQPMSVGNITTVDFGTNGVWFWEPDAIGGQSGSGIYSYTLGFQFGLLTWEWNSHGAGQKTSEMYKQARSRSVAGFPRPPGLIELPDFDLTGFDTSDCDDPIVENGFVAEASIVDLPVWAEDVIVVPPPDDRPYGFTSLNFIAYCHDMIDIHERWIVALESRDENIPTPGDGNGGNGTDPDDGPTFGLDP